MSDNQGQGVTQVLADIKDLTVSYAKQETVEPLRLLGRFLSFGVVGSIFVGVGVILLTLAGLRALQAETGTALTGNWSWVPYLAAVVLLVVLTLVSVFTITRKSTRPTREAIR